MVVRKRTRNRDNPAGALFANRERVATSRLPAVADESDPRRQAERAYLNASRVYR
jgi:hypothetical protein